MNLKSKTYMKSAEFKARQIWLPFTDAPGVVLELLEDTKRQAWEWFKTWRKDLRTPRTIKKQEQLKFNFLNWLVPTPSSAKIGILKI